MDKESTETDFGKANSKYIGIAFSFSLGLGFHGSSLFFLVEEAVQLWLISAKVRRNMLFAFSLALSISSAAVSSPGSDGT